MSTMHFIEEIKSVVQVFICYTKGALSCVIYCNFCIEKGHGDKHDFTSLSCLTRKTKGFNNGLS